MRRKPPGLVSISAMAFGTLIVLAGVAGCFRNDRQSDTPAPGQSAPPATPSILEPAFSSAGSPFDGPLRIDLTDSGWLLVSDPKKRFVHRVSPVSLKSDRSLRIEGTPLGVGMLDGEIFVGVKEAHTVEIYNHKGESRGYLAEPGSVEYPGDLAIDPDAGLVFVLDGVAGSVKVFRVADRVQTMVLGAGRLLSPTALEVNPARQEVMVSDYGSASEKASVKVFSYAPETPDELVATLTAGSCNFMGCSGGFSRPRGLAVHNGKLFLVDALLGQIIVFDRDTLQKVGELGTPEAAARELRLPSDIAINALGDVFVTSTLSKAVVLFRGGAL